MTERDYQSLIELNEADIRSGQNAVAASRLRTLKPAQIPREHRRALANLCRRVDLDIQALRILTPVIRPEAGSADASPEERAEYAGSLLKTGAVNEALSLLSSIDAEAFPQVSLYHAFGHMRVWDYAGAIPHLEAYIKVAPNEYQRLVGRVNLATALMATSRYSEALAHLDTCLADSIAGHHKRLEANCYEVCAQIHSWNANFSAARADLAHVPKGKWHAIVEALASGSIEPLERYRADAIADKDWESLRDIDLFQLKLRFNEDKFQQLLFGTPFRPYRERVVSILKRQTQARQHIWGVKDAPRFDLATGDATGVTLSNPGNTVHQLLAVLLSDLYRPWSIGSIFSELFPGEHFNVFSSPNRVHQLLWRLRRWLDANQIPAVLNEFGGQYRLELTGPFAFVLPEAKPGLDEPHIYLRKILFAFGTGTTFSSRDVQARLGISSSSFKRLAAWALEHRKMERLGASRATVYRLIDAA